jgi:hypothetical protein
MSSEAHGESGGRSKSIRLITDLQRGANTYSPGQQATRASEFDSRSAPRERKRPKKSAGYRLATASRRSRGTDLSENDGMDAPASSAMDAPEAEVSRPMRDADDGVARVQRGASRTGQPAAAQVVVGERVRWAGT